MSVCLELHKVIHRLNGNKVTSPSFLFHGWSVNNRNSTGRTAPVEGFFKVKAHVLVLANVSAIFSIASRRIGIMARGSARGDGASRSFISPTPIEAQRVVE